MVFCSIPFLFYFLPIFLLLYYVLPFKLKNFILLVFSLIFYAWGEPVYISLVIISSVVDYINGRLLEKFSSNNNIRKVFLILSIITNLGLLGIFKYSGLYIDTLNSLFSCGINNPHLPLPIGISFFTFQTMSYSIDVYRRNVKAEHNFITYMTYVSMFPQLIAGPIVRYETVSQELHTRTINFDNACSGFYRFLLGMFKKVLIANQIGSLWDTTLASVSSELSVTGAWLGAFAFAFQIYFDFSGYSDMAIGLGKMLGFNYLENFNYPYIAKSITDFWRRWHISLSEWFRDYVYIPLGGNRCSKSRNIFNIVVVWALTGFWHGASWNYMLWGIYFAVLLVIEKYLLKSILAKIPTIFSHLITIILLLISWVIFAVEDFGLLKHYLSIMFGLSGKAFINNDTLFNLNNYGVVLLFAVLFSIPIAKSINSKLESKKTANSILSFVKMIAILILFVIATSCLINDSYNPFLYFRF